MKDIPLVSSSWHFFHSFSSRYSTENIAFIPVPTSQLQASQAQTEDENQSSPNTGQDFTLFLCHLGGQRNIVQFRGYMLYEWHNSSNNR